MSSLNSSTAAHTGPTRSPFVATQDVLVTDEEVGMPIKVLAFAGSLRRDSYNKKLTRVAAAAAKDAGADVTLLDLADWPLPIYDGDLEDRDGVPERVLQLKAMFRAHDAFLISSPEYNSSLSAALKNLIDWLSRPVKDEPSLACFRGKTAALFSASPGALGGLRGLVHLRAILGNLGVLLIADQLAIGKADEAFADDDVLKNPKQGALLADIVRELVRVAGAVRR
jgi:chromate reductase